MQISDTTKRNQEPSVGKLASCPHVRDEVFNASAATFVCCLHRPQRHLLLAEWKRHYNRFTELGESLAVNSSGLAGLDDVWMVRRKTGRTEGCVFGGDECVPEVSDLAYCCS